MPDNIRAKDALGNTITLRTRDDGSGVQTQLVGTEAAAQSDGHSATIGSTGDVAWGGTGAATLVAALKDIALHLRASLVSDISDRAARALGHVIVDSGSLDVLDRAARALGHVVVDSGAVDVTDRVARALGTADVTDRAARALGHVVVDNPTVDVNDRAARALGHVIVDSGTAVVTAVDGGLATVGTTTGAAVTTNAGGTLQQYLRGLVAIFADLWDNTNHVLRVTDAAGAVPAIHRGSSTITATITATGQTSSTVAIGQWSMLGLVLPAAFTSTSISFSVSHDDTTYQPLYDVTNTQVTVPVAPGRSYDLPAELASWPYVRIVSAAAEAALRTLVVVAKG